MVTICNEVIPRTNDDYTIKAMQYFPPKVTSKENPFRFSHLLSLFIMIVFLPDITAQSNIANVKNLASQCSNGHVKSCEKLKHCALNDNDWQVRKEAVKNITDQNILANIAVNDKVYSVRYSAVLKLTDQDIL